MDLEPLSPNDSSVTSEIRHMAASSTQEGSANPQAPHPQQARLALHLPESVIGPGEPQRLFDTFLECRWRPHLRSTESRRLAPFIIRRSGHPLVVMMKTALNNAVEQRARLRVCNLNENVANSATVPPKHGVRLHEQSLLTPALEPAR